MNNWEHGMVDRHQPSFELPPSKGNPMEAATEAAARINALLIAQGMLKPSQVSLPNKSKTSGSTHQQSTPLEVRTFYCKVPNWASASSLTNKIIAEVDINNVLPACRNNLTRTSTQEEISTLSGATIATKGRFMNDEERAKAEPGDRPLYLCLEATTQEAIDKAVGRIQELVDGKDVYKDRRFGGSGGFGISSSLLRPPPVSGEMRTPTSTATGLSSSMAYISDKLLVGLEHAPPNFDVKNRLLGPGGSYLQHIMTETTAKVMLRGRGSGFIEPDLGHEAFEPMYIFVQHPSTQGLQAARQLAKNLIETVQQEYVQFQYELAAKPPPPTIAAAPPQQMQLHAPVVSAATFVAGLQQQTQVGLTLVGTSLPSSLSVMPVAAAIGPPGLLNPGQTVLLDTSLPPPPGTHFQPVTSQPPPQAITLDGGLMSVQPTTSFVLSQPAQGPPPGSLVLTHQPELASGTIVLSSQPVVSGPPPDSYVLAAPPPGATAPGSFVLTQPAPAPPGTLVLSQQPGGQFTVRQQLLLPMEPISGSQAQDLALQAGPVFSQASCSRQDSQGVSVYQIPSGSQLTVMQPPPGQMHESGGSSGPSAIYTLSLPLQSSSSSSSASLSAAATSRHQNSPTPRQSAGEETIEGRRRTGPRKRRFMENDDVDYSNLLGYQHGPLHLMNTLTVSSASDGSSSLTATSKPTTETSTQQQYRATTDTRDCVSGAAASVGSCTQRMSFSSTSVQGQVQNVEDMDTRKTPDGTSTDFGVITATSVCGSDANAPPVSQYSGKPQMYIMSQPQDQSLVPGAGQASLASFDASATHHHHQQQYYVHHVLADPAAIYSQPSFIYHQQPQPTIAYGQFSVAPDITGVGAAPQFSGHLLAAAPPQQQTSTVYVQQHETGPGGATVAGLPTHQFMFPPSSIAQGQMMFGQRSMVPTSFAPVSCGGADAMMPPPSMLAPPPPPPPPPTSGMTFHAGAGGVGSVSTGATPMSYWMTLN